MVADVLAHQGGWDEVLFVGVPILVFTVVLIVANRRASRMPKHDDSGPRPSHAQDHERR